MVEMRKEGWSRVAIAAFLGHFVLSIWFVERAQLNADEGWYLYAARAISMGQTPYLEFSFFQGPVYPRVMAGLVDAGPGSLIAGRWWSFLMLLVSTGVTSLAARRVAGPAGAAIAMICVGLHPLIIGTSVLAKPYALTLLLMATGLFLLLGKEGKSLRTVMGFVLLTLAAGARISLLAFILPLMLAQRGRDALLSAIGVVFGGLLLLPSLQVVAPSVLWDQLIAFHVSDGGTFSGRLAWLFHASTVWLVFWFGLGRGNSPIPGLKIACVLAVVAHLIPSQLHIEHLVVLAPPLALILASSWASSLTRPKVLVLGVAIMMLSAGAGLRFVHLDSGESTVEQNMEIGRWLQEHVPEGQAILTKQVSLAVEADRDVMQGFEMGRFGSVERAQVLGMLTMGVGGVALTPGDFDEALRSEITNWSEEHFQERRVEEPYGQFGERLWLWAGASIWMR